MSNASLVAPIEGMAGMAGTGDEQGGSHTELVLGLLLALLQWVVPMTPGVFTLIWIAILGLCVDIVWRGIWTRRLNVAGKSVIAVLVAVVVAVGGYLSYSAKADDGLKPITPDEYADAVLRRLPAPTPDMRLHDLRHSCASLLVAEGVNLKVVQDILGHSQISVTADTYAHVARPSRQDAASRIDSALGWSIPPSSIPVGVNAGVKTDQSPQREDRNLQIPWDFVVSPLGIEPRTNRLRVCCSTN